MTTASEKVWIAPNRQPVTVAVADGPCTPEAFDVALTATVVEQLEFTQTKVINPVMFSQQRYPLQYLRSVAEDTARSVRRKIANDGMVRTSEVTVDIVFEVRVRAMGADLPQNLRDDLGIVPTLVT